MIPDVKLPLLDRPGFCQVCYCEECDRGFYERARDAVMFNDGRVICNESGCTGQVRATPTLGWQRVTRCRSCGHDPRRVGVAPPETRLLAS